MFDVVGTTEDRLKEKLARSAKIWSSDAMEDIPSIGWCRIDMIGGPGLRACLGDELYDFVARAVLRLQGVDGELLRKTYLVKMLNVLSTMDRAAIEDLCIQALQLPWSPSYIARRRAEAEAKAITRLQEKGPMVFSKDLPKAEPEAA